MMQTSNMLDFYLKLNNNYALIFQSVKMSCSMEKKESPALQTLGKQLPGLLKILSTQYENSLGICIFSLSMSKQNFKEDVRNQKSRTIDSNGF